VALKRSGFLLSVFINYSGIQPNLNNQLKIISTIFNLFFCRLTMRDEGSS